MSTTPDRPDPSDPTAEVPTPRPESAGDAPHSEPVGDVPPPEPAAPPPPPVSFGSPSETPPPPPPVPATAQPGVAYGSPAAGPGPAYGPGAPGPAPAYAAPSGAPLSPQEEKGWSLAAHLLVLVAGFLAPLIIWLVFKGRGPFLEHHAKESLNFQITVTIAGLISGLAIFLLVGIVMLLALIPWMIIMPIIAAVKANNGEWYRYPLTLRLVK
jgi:uncharacterized Tic20 family protein